jgi:hypothetical protein
MVIIKTKYLSPTNTKGARIKASARGVFLGEGYNMAVIIPYDYSLIRSPVNFELVHFEAVKELIKACNLTWDISNMGYGSDNDGYYFTFKNSVMEA